MIVFIYGTTAEAIKIAPVARRLIERGIPFQQWLTLQHTDSLREIIPTLGLPKPDRIIANGNGGRALKSKRDVAGWLWTVSRWMIANIRTIRRELPKNTVVVVHGDTLTTVLGAFIAKRLRVPSAHIEAGLRSGDWRNPFPEELDRRIVGILATIHYPPSEEAAAHLAKRKNVVFTHGNTVIDAVIDQGKEGTETAEFGIVLLHRFEFISNPQLVLEAMQTLADKSPVPLRLMMDAYSEGPLADALRSVDQSKFIPQAKLKHQDFVGLLKSAAFVVTDSGGIQAEAALIGVPTLIHRKTTEQREGLGRNIFLSKWDQTKLAEFLRDYESLRVSLVKPEISPSQVIVDDLILRGFSAS